MVYLRPPVDKKSNKIYIDHLFDFFFLQRRRIPMQNIRGSKNNKQPTIILLNSAPKKLGMLLDMGFQALIFTFKKGQFCGKKWVIFGKKDSRAPTWAKFFKKYLLVPTSMT